MSQQPSLEHYALGPPTPNVYNGLDYSDIGLRAKLWSSGEWVFSGEAAAFLPGAHSPSQPAQEGNTGGAAEGERAERIACSALRASLGSHATISPPSSDLLNASATK